MDDVESEQQRDVKPGFLDSDSLYPLRFVGTDDSEE